MKNRHEEAIHSLTLLLIGFLGLLFILICKKIQLSVACYFLVLTGFFWAGLSPWKYIKTFLVALAFAFGFFLLSQVYPAMELRDFPVMQWGPIVFFRLALKHGFEQWLKLTLLASLSMASGLVIDYTQILMSLMQRKKISLKLGYPLLIAMNSIVLLKEEMSRIKMVSSQRKLPLLTRHLPMMPLLVFAIRHSQRGALALVTRGLSEKKSFYFNYQTSKSDRFILYVYGVVYFLLVALNFFVLK